MDFAIDEKIFDVFPDMRLAAVILRDLNNQAGRPESRT